MSQELRGELRGGPGSTRQSRHAVTDGQIHPFDESGVEPSRQAQPLQGGREICLCPQAHHRRNSHELAPPIAFLHLAIDQARRHLPLAHVPPSPTSCEPLAKMGCEGIEVQI